MPVIESTRAATRWTTRIIPFVLAAAVGVATYAVVVRVCSSYLIDTHRRYGAAIVILVLYLLFFLLMVTTYARTIAVANTDPGLVPLGPLAVERNSRERKRTKTGAQQDLESQAYYAGPDLNPDSPGLEQFYAREVFVCDSDGRPKWCSTCCNWKADRVHHSSELGRCVYRMDHYCPWVGGMIGENSFKFFTQFTTYTACYCAVVLGATAFTLRKKIEEGSGLDPWVLAALVLAAFFGLFTFLMTVTSLRYIILNMTNVDMLGAHSKVYQLAVQVPRGTRSSDKFIVVTYPLPKPGQETNGYSSRTPTLEGAYGKTNGSRPTTRDDLATRTFAILKTEPGENPWHLSTWKNWQTIMGSNPLDWLLPIRKSPCVNHETQESFYPMGNALKDVRVRYGLPRDPVDHSNGFELKDLPSSNRT
ncbi:Uu.00g109130.m01.CDS01 [Anthostomella pinea]|uniref:Palmitoyltransferase n=1 Tax=Anthostomella pinea TaxID=933095 RepID=A0AAI8VFC4_9PEZI|nr:Uu.00g109130.m01.CDS01 [Anthostomella pinea]